MSEPKVKKPGWIKSTLLQWLGVPITLMDGGFWSQLGTQSFGGQRITVNTALQLSTVWACVRLISETISTLPLFLYQTNANGSRSLVRTHQLYELLHSQPNADMTAVIFWEATVASLLLWGNSYCEIVRGAGYVTALNFLDPARMYLRRLPDGTLEYRYTEYSSLYPNQDFSGRYDGAVGGKSRIIAEGDMMHVPAFTTNGILGLSPVAYGANVIGGAVSTDFASAETFKNAMRSPGIITMDMVMSKEQRDIVREHVRRVSEEGGVMVLEKGTGFQGLTFKPEDAQLLASREFNISEICRWFRVPPYMVGHTEKSTAWGTGLEQMQIGFVTFVLAPWLRRIEQAIRKSLLTPAEKTKYFAEFSLDALLRADSVGRAALYSSYAQNGVKTRNELRALENDPPLPGGDDLTVQSNLMPISMLGRQQAAPPPVVAPPVDAGLSKERQMASEALAQALARPQPAINIDARTTIRQPDLTVNVPDQKAPDVRVEVAAPVVNVSTPMPQELPDVMEIMERVDRKFDLEKQNSVDAALNVAERERLERERVRLDERKAAPGTVLTQTIKEVVERDADGKILKVRITEVAQ